jgi:serine/threonine protein kinase
MALEYCHANGVLHLDVKPANVMVKSEKWIKLGDFGNSANIHQLDLFQVSFILSHLDVIENGCNFALFHFCLSTNKE